MKYLVAQSKVIIENIAKKNGPIGEIHLTVIKKKQNSKEGKAKRERFSGSGRFEPQGSGNRSKTTRLRKRHVTRYRFGNKKISEISREGYK